VNVESVNVLLASRLGRRPKRLKEMQLAAAAAAGGGNSCLSSSIVEKQHLETSGAVMRGGHGGLCMSASVANSSLDVAGVHAELQVYILHSSCSFSFT